MIRPESPESKPRKAWIAVRRTVVVVGCLGVLFALLSPAFQQTICDRQRAPCKNNLKQIGLALHNYHQSYNSFPPAVVHGPDGKPWHSWRVLIHPFLEEQSLAEKYRFDEPWNGPNNSKLVDQRPEVFACRGFDGVVNVPKHRTSYVAVVGHETVWPGATSTHLSDISDGTSNTVLVIEVRDAGIPWLAPEDLSMEEASVPPTGDTGRRSSSVHTGGGHVLMGDGTVRFVNTNIAPDIWKGLLTRAGGEEINDF